MATNKAFKARFDGTCKRCGKEILGVLNHPDGAHWINLFNFPKPKTAYHADCQQPTVSPYGNGNNVPPVQEEQQNEQEVIAQPVSVPSNGNGHVEPSGDIVSVLGSALLPYFEAKLKTKPDISEVTELVSLAVEEAMSKASRRVVIEDKTRNVEVKLDSAHEMLPKLVALVNRRKHVLLWGDSGSGKSHTAAAIAEALGLPFYYVSLANQTPEYRLTGTMTANGEYSPTPFFHAYTKGGVFCIDEIDAANDNLLTSLNSALANGHASFPVVGQVARHPDFVCICTANTPALGASQTFTSRRPLDPATRDRFAFLRWDIDPKLERELTLARNPQAESWVAWIQAVRAYAKTNFPKLIVTMRAAIDGAELLQDSDVWTVSEIAEMVLFRGIDQDSVRKILGAHPLPTMKAEVAYA